MEPLGWSDSWAEQLTGLEWKTKTPPSKHATEASRRRSRRRRRRSLKNTIKTGLGVGGENFWEEKTYHNFRILLSIPCTSWPLEPLKHHPQAPSSCLEADLWSRYSTLSLTPFFFQRNNRKKELQIFTLSHTFWWQLFHHQRELHQHKLQTPNSWHYGK